MLISSKASSSSSSEQCKPWHTGPACAEAHARHNAATKTRRRRRAITGAGRMRSGGALVCRTCVELGVPEAGGTRGGAQECRSSWEVLRRRTVETSRSSGGRRHRCADSSPPIRPVMLERAGGRKGVDANESKLEQIRETSSKPGQRKLHRANSGNLDRIRTISSKSEQFNQSSPPGRGPLQGPGAGSTSSISSRRAEPIKLLELPENPLPNRSISSIRSIGSAPKPLELGKLGQHRLNLANLGTCFSISEHGINLAGIGPISVHVLPALVTFRPTSSIFG